MSQQRSRVRSRVPVPPRRTPPSAWTRKWVALIRDTSRMPRPSSEGILTPMRALRLLTGVLLLAGCHTSDGLGGIGGRWLEQRRQQRRHGRRRRRPVARRPAAARRPVAPASERRDQRHRRRRRRRDARQRRGRQRGGGCGRNTGSRELRAQPSQAVRQPVLRVGLPERRGQLHLWRRLRGGQRLREHLAKAGRRRRLPLPAVRARVVGNGPGGRRRLRRRSPVQLRDRRARRRSERARRYRQERLLPVLPARSISCPRTKRR